MSIFKERFKTKYKIIPVYKTPSEICGYTVMTKSIIGWAPIPMCQQQKDNITPVDNIFKTYEDAITFLKHETKILTNEEIYPAKND